MNLAEIGETLLHSHNPTGCQLTLETSIDPLELDVDTSQVLGLLATELLLNSLKHGFTALPSHKKAKNECLAWIILISSGSVGLDFLKWFKNFNTCLLVIS